MNAQPWQERLWQTTKAVGAALLGLLGVWMLANMYRGWREDREAAKARSKIPVQELDATLRSETAVTAAFERQIEAHAQAAQDHAHATAVIEKQAAKIEAAASDDEARVAEANKAFGG